MGSNEWSIISNELNALKPEKALSDALSNYRFALAVIANSKVMLSLAGASTRDVLSKGSSINFFSNEWKERAALQVYMRDAMSRCGKEQRAMIIPYSQGIPLQIMSQAILLM